MGLDRKLSTSCFNILHASEIDCSVEEGKLWIQQYNYVREDTRSYTSKEESSLTCSSGLFNDNKLKRKRNPQVPPLIFNPLALFMCLLCYWECTQVVNKKKKFGELNSDIAQI